MCCRCVGACVLRRERQLQIRAETENKGEGRGRTLPPQSREESERFSRAATTRELIALSLIDKAKHLMAEVTSVLIFK